MRAWPSRVIEPGQALQFARMEPAVRDRDAQVDRLARGRRLEADLVDREPEIVEPADPAADGLAVPGGSSGTSLSSVHRAR